MARLDIARPFQVSRLRRRSLSTAGIVLTLGGLLPSRQRDLESVIKAVRNQSWLSAKMLFLKRIHEVFHLWHVVHRPFSYSFAVLVVAHIAVAHAARILLGLMETLLSVLIASTVTLFFMRGYLKTPFSQEAIALAE